MFQKPLDQRKRKKQQLLDTLQHNIFCNQELFKNEFRVEFEKFLLNYGMVLLNPSKKNDLFCSQLLFLAFTSPKYSKTNQDNGSGFFEEEAEWMTDEELENNSEEEEKNKETVLKKKEKEKEEGEGEGEEKEDDDDEDNIDEKLNKYLELKKKEIEEYVINDSFQKEKLQKKHENPLMEYDDLNEYLNFLMIQDKESVNFTEEFFFLVSQLLVHYKHDLYSTVLYSILKGMNKMRKHIPLISYVEIMVFMSDIKSNRLRYYIFKSVVNSILELHKKSRDERLKNGILDILQEAYIENQQKKRIRKKYASLNKNHFGHLRLTEEVNNFACSVLIELAKKNIYITKKNANIIAEGLFFKNLKIVKSVCFTLLGKYDNKDLVVKVEREKVDLNKKMQELKNIHNKTHQKMTKGKIKNLQKKKEKILDEVNKNDDSSDDEKNLEKKLSKYVNFTFIDLIYDAYKFAQSIFNLLTSKYKFGSGKLRFLFLNILCRIYQRNRIVEENFFLYFENMIHSIKNKIILSRYLSIFLQCLHDNIPSYYIQRIVYVLIKKFVCEYLCEEIVYLAINAITEIIIKFPLCLNEDIFEGIIIFKNYKNKNISQIVKRFINVAKSVSPEVVSRKHLDQQAAQRLKENKIKNELSIPSDSCILNYSYLLNKHIKQESSSNEGEEEEEEEGNKKEGNVLNKREVKGEERKQNKKLKRKEEKRKEEIQKFETNQNILCQEILTNEDFKKLRRIREYIETNNKVDMNELREICEMLSSKESNTSNSSSNSDESDQDKEKIITGEDLRFKRKLKKHEMVKIKKCSNEVNERLKTNKEKEKRKSAMMLIQKFKKKKRNALAEYGKIKKKLKGKLAARAKRRDFLQKKIAKKIGKRKK